MTDGSEWDMEIWRPEVEHVTRGRSPSVTSSTEGRPISMSHEVPCVICFVVWPTSDLVFGFWLIIYNFYQQSGERSCVRSTLFGRWRCNIRRLHSNKLKRHLANPIVTWKCQMIDCRESSSFDNAQSHAMAFQPICEAARSWSDDNVLWCCRRQWQHWTWCVCGTNSPVWRPCWIFSGQHDSATCKPHGHGLHPLTLCAIVWTVDCWLAAKSPTGFTDWNSPIRIGIPTWIRIEFKIEFRIEFLILNWNWNSD